METERRVDRPRVWATEIIEEAARVLQCEDVSWTQCYLAEREDGSPVEDCEQGLPAESAVVLAGRASKGCDLTRLWTAWQVPAVQQVEERDIVEVRSVCGLGALYYAFGRLSEARDPGCGAGVAFLNETKRVPENEDIRNAYQLRVAIERVGAEAAGVVCAGVVAVTDWNDEHDRDVDEVIRLLGTAAQRGDEWADEVERRADDEARA